MHLLRALLIVVLAAGTTAAEADPPGRVGRLNHISGAISFAPAAAPDDWSEAVLNRPLTSGDRLWADRGARGELHVGSTAVRFASLTGIDVLHLDDERIQLRLSEGVLNIRVRELETDDRIEVATPEGAAVLREPGSYRIAAAPATGMTYVTVHFGEAEVLTSTLSFLVPSGQVALVSAAGQVAFEVGRGGDELDRWSAERDRREDHVASTRYVSSHMTGYEDLDHYGSWRTVSEYGAVWVPARVAPGWAPYRHGRWSWVSPWGWTWIDDAPWGFAPFHYGRWVRVHDYWAWAPGPLVRRPVYAPALVAFVGGPHWSVSVAQGPAVGWFPLGWREPFRPWYHASQVHIRGVNVTHVTNVRNLDGLHVHRHRPHAVTVVPHRSFVSGARAAESRLHLRQGELARAQVQRDRAPAAPVLAGIARERAPRASAPAGSTPEARSRGAVAWSDRGAPSGRHESPAASAARPQVRQPPQPSTPAAQQAGAIRGSVPDARWSPHEPRRRLEASRTPGAGQPSSGVRHEGSRGERRAERRHGPSGGPRSTR